jgi:superfamily II DNA/RNA helicase
MEKYMFKIGDSAYDKLTGARVKVLERVELWGYVTYKVYSPETKQVYALSSQHLSSVEDTTLHDEAYIRFIAALSRIKNELAAGILSSIGDSILPLPHQIYALQRAISGPKIRYLLADEVGLGKTIEAGLIIKELKTRGLVKRVLVVCPKSLVTQWHREMLDKFGEKYNIILPEDYDTIRRLYGEGRVYEHFAQVICPLDSIKPLEKRAGWDQARIENYNNERINAIIEAGWDLVVIDEAHRVAGSSGEVARHKLGSALAKTSPYLLLLTATPHSGKTEPFLRLVRLLDDTAFPDIRAITKEQVAPYIIRTEKREAIDHEGNRLFKDRHVKVIEAAWEERHSLQRKLYELVTDYVAHGYNRAIKEKKHYLGFLMVLMQRLVTSSTAAIRESIEKRIAVLEAQETRVSRYSLEDLLELGVEEAIDDVIATQTLDLKKELRELKDILVVAKQAEYQYRDAKFELLLDLLNGLFSEDEARKVIIFTEFVATQNYLKAILEKQGFAVSVLNGSLEIDERNAVLREFRESKQVLISTDAGGEGLNLQFANIVINYDLPWNPMKIEQRIGRVDRIGQEKDVLVFNFLLRDTVENRVRKVLEEKLSTILAQMGIDKLQDVMDSELADVDFTDVYIKTIANPKYADQYMKRLETEINQQVKQAQVVRDIIKDDKTFDHDTAASLKQSNISAILQEMYLNYLKWKKKDTPKDIFTRLDLNNPEIKEIITSEILWPFIKRVPTLNLPDLPNEKGFWSLWEITIGDETADRRIFPLFMNTEGVLRLVSASRVWDELLKPGREIILTEEKVLSQQEYEVLEQKAKEMAYDFFLELKRNHDQRNHEQYRKYAYSLQLRLEAVEKLGLENVKRRRKQALLKEKESLEKEYAMKQAIMPVLRPLFIAYME